MKFECGPFAFDYYSDSVTLSTLRPLYQFKVLEKAGVGEAKSEATADDVKKTEHSEEDKKKEEEKKEEDRRKLLAEPRKAVVVDRTVFQAFAHFDQNQSGYQVIPVY